MISDADDDSDEDEGDDDSLEVVVTILPREAVLTELGVTDEEFEAVVGRALDDLDAEGRLEDDDEPALEDVDLILNGRTFRLGELATVEVSGDLSELGLEEE